MTLPRRDDPARVYAFEVSYSPIPGPVAPVGPPLPSNPQGPYTAANPYRPRLASKAKKVGAPLGVLIALGVVATIVIGFFTVINPAGAIIGLILATIVMALVLAAYLWLDRWEPEPPRLLIFAFLWGAAVAVVGALGVGLGLQLIFPSMTEFVGAVIQAPIVEEGLKGLFLIIMLTGRRRAEMNSLTDCLIYAGMVGAGFAWVEDILYISSGDGISGALLTAALRLVLGPFAHPLFTSMTALGVYFSMKQKGTGAKIGCILLGYVGAMLLHGLWNGSSSLSESGLSYFVVYALVMIPIFVTMIIVAVKSRTREQRMVAAKLLGMVQAGLVRPNEAPWLESIRNRKLAIAQAKLIGGGPASKTFRVFAAAVVELAFVRDRIDRGFGSDKVYAQQQDAAQAVVFARHEAPVLIQMQQFRLPVLGMGVPVAPAPHPSYPQQPYQPSAPPQQYQQEAPQQQDPQQPYQPPAPPQYPSQQAPPQAPVGAPTDPKRPEPPDDATVLR